MRGAGALFGIDADGAEPVHLHADALKPEGFGVRRAADGGEYEVGLDLGAVFQRHAFHAAIGGYTAHAAAARVQPHALLRHRLRQRFAQIVVETAQRQRLAHHDMHLAAQAREDGGELDGDVAAAQQHHALRPLGQEERVVGDDAVFAAGELRRPRAAAGRDDDAFGADDPAADIEPVRVDEGRRRLEALYARAVQQARIDAVEPPDFGVLVGDQRLPVMPAGRELPAEAARLLAAWPRIRPP